MSVLFISDLHLEAERPDITRAFLSFLDERARRAEALYILGDFFEAWIGDDGMDAFQRSIAQSLRQVADGGTRIYLMHGNRDFLIGKAFCREAGCTLLPDPSVIDLYGEPVLLMHGDSLCTRDEACAAGCATRSRSGYCATCRWPPGTSWHASCARKAARRPA